MMNAHLLNTVIEEAPLGARVFYLEGGLRGNRSGYAFQEAVRAQFGGGGKVIIIDLAGVDPIDSCGIGILAACVVAAMNAGGQIVFSAVSDRIKKLLAVVWPLDFVKQIATVDAATCKSR